MPGRGGEGVFIAGENAYDEMCDVVSRKQFVIIFIITENTQLAAFIIA